jgi:hypothetical protein
MTLLNGETSLMQAYERGRTCCTDSHTVNVSLLTEKFITEVENLPGPFQIHLIGDTIGEHEVAITIDQVTATRLMVLRLHLKPVFGVAANVASN